MSAATVIIRQQRPRVVDDTASPVVVAQPVRNVVRAEPVRVVVLGETSLTKVQAVDARQTVVVVKRANTTININNGILTYHGTPDGAVVGWYGQFCRDTLHGLFWQCRSNPSGDQWEVS